jgi:glycine cleavage system H lipoate-binding protein
MKEPAKTKSQHRVAVFQVTENECIWMKAGVVNFRLCDCGYDCNHCAFDKAMQKAMNTLQEGGEKAEKSGWAQSLRKKYRGTDRPCRHTLTGRIRGPKICPYNYECYHCPFDQMLYEQDLAEEIKAAPYTLASGYKLADGCYYHMGHTWARFEHGGQIRVGFDDFLVRLFGALQAITLPPLGAKLKQNDTGWTFERGNHSAAVLSPITGTVLAVNHKCREHPEIPHEDPYGTGWLCILETDHPKQNLRRLYFGSETIRWIEKESQKLLGLLGPEYERLAATGGEPVGDVYADFPNIGWDVLAKAFLRTERR